MLKTKELDVELSDSFKFLKPCRLQGFIHNEVKPSVLIFPGGGYGMVSPREAQPVAQRFFEKGYNAFILTYSTKNKMPDVIYPMQLLQAMAAILYIRGNAEKLNANDDVITCGFSAGGHLASMTAVYYDRDIVLNSFKIDNTKARPSATILCYPVISSFENPHIGSFINLTGSENCKEHLKVSTELSVNINTPPVFLWHTAEDLTVNVSNSIDFSKQLSKFNVPFELHIFQNGAHGLSMCDQTTSEGNANYIKPDVAIWFDLCITWLNKRFKNSCKV